MKRIKLLLLGAIALITTFNLSAQSSREIIRSTINSIGKCYNVAITKTNGDLAIFDAVCEGDNLPEDLVDAVIDYSYKFLSEDRYELYIRDITLTESGNWLMVYNYNGVRWSNIPAGLEQELRNRNAARDWIYSASFNDDGMWIVVSANNVAASHDELMVWMAEGAAKYGEVWSAFINDDGAVAVFEQGIIYMGDVPQGLKDAISNTNLDYFYVKFAGDSWFIADMEGNYDYNM